MLDRVHQLDDTAMASARLAALPVPANPASVASLSSIHSDESRSFSATPTPIPIPIPTPAPTAVTSGSASVLQSAALPVAQKQAPVVQQQSSFAATSEALTSNLRKIIVSSSATISRKLNISTSSQPSTLPQVLQPPQTPQPQSPLPPQTPTLPQSTQRKQSAAADADFEARSAGYQHPVIKPNSVDTSTNVCDKLWPTRQSSASANDQTLNKDHYLTSSIQLQPQRVRPATVLSKSTSDTTYKR